MKKAEKRARNISAAAWNELREYVFAGVATRWEKAVYRAGYKLYGESARKLESKGFAL